jgi:hypothetical protein
VSSKDEIEQTEQNPELHMWRRAALGFLCMPWEELFGKIRDYTQGLRALAECLDVAQVRIEVGLWRRHP